MERIGSTLPNSPLVKGMEATLKFKRSWLNEGFTHISNNLLRDTSVSVGARILYMLLTSRCFSKDFSYPGRITLMKELGVSKDTFYSYKKELEDKGWLEVRRRGLGKTNLYFLKKYK